MVWCKNVCHTIWWCMVGCFFRTLRFFFPWMNLDISEISSLLNFLMKSFHYITQPITQLVVLASYVGGRGMIRRPGLTKTLKRQRLFLKKQKARGPSKGTFKTDVPCNVRLGTTQNPPCTLTWAHWKGQTFYHFTFSWNTWTRLLDNYHCVITLNVRKWTCIIWCVCFTIITIR